MVAHLQVHAATKHKVNTSTAVPSFSSTATLSSADVMNASTVPAQDLARSRSASSVRGRSRSRRRRDEHLAFPCPDCRERSFATEAGLYSHRTLFCGLRDQEKSTSLDYKCTSPCKRAFTTPSGLTTHRRHCQSREPANSEECHEGSRGDHENNSVGAGQNYLQEGGGIGNQGLQGGLGQGEEGVGSPGGGEKERSIQGQGVEVAAGASISSSQDDQVGAGRGVLMSVQKRDDTDDIMNLGSVGGDSSRGTTGGSLRSALASSKRSGEKRSSTSVASTSKRSKSEVWVVRKEGTGRGGGGGGDLEQSILANAENSLRMNESRDNLDHEVAGNLENGEGNSEHSKKRGHVERSLLQVQGGVNRSTQSRNVMGDESGQRKGITETPRGSTAVDVSSGPRRRLDFPSPVNRTQRSKTLNYSRSSLSSSASPQAASSSTGDQNSNSKGGVTMQVSLPMKGGIQNITYRVPVGALMQKVVAKAAARLEKAPEQVVLIKDGGIVDPNALAGIYTNAKLVAKLRFGAS